MITGPRGPTPRALFSLLGAMLCSSAALAIEIDDRGEMRLGMRAYTAARVSTDRMGGEDDPLSFPNSGVGHLHQHRTFLELRFDHDITRLTEEGWGPARPLGWLPLNTLKYNLPYRGR